MTSLEAACVQWIKCRAKHAKAVADLSKLGREMGIAYDEMVLRVFEAGLISVDDFEPVKTARTK